MATFHIDAEVAGIRGRKPPVPVPDVLVDSGSEFSWIPEMLHRAAGVKVAKKELAFVMANDQRVTRSTGYALLRVAGFETVDEVVFGLPRDSSLLGARTLEGFGASVGARRKRLVAAGPHPAAPGGSETEPE